MRILGNFWYLFYFIFIAIPPSLTASGFGFQIESLLPLIICFLFIVGSLTSNRKISISNNSFLLLLLPISVAISYLLNSGSIIDIFKLIAFLTISFSVAIILQSEEQRDRFLHLVIVLGLIGGLLYLINPSLWGSVRVNILSFELRTVFCYFLSFAASLSLMYWVDKQQNYYLAIFLLLAFVILISGARGALLLLFLVYFLTAGGNANLRFLQLGLAILVLPMLYLSQDIFLRTSSIWDLSINSSSTYRLDLFQAAVTSFFTDFTFFGRSGDEYLSLLSSKTQTYYFNILFTDFTSDSDFVRFLLKFGAIPTFCLLLLVWRWGSISFTSSTTSFDSNISRVAFLVFSFSLFFDDILTNPVGWILLGFFIGTNKIELKTT